MNAAAWGCLAPFERDFPIHPRPFAEIGRRLGMTEAQVLEMMRQGVAQGVVARVGATLRPHVLGDSTLAALAVPPERLSEVAALVSAFDAVNHNYEREGHYNLWFVVTAASVAEVTAVLEAIERQTGLQPLDLPITTAFHIDLGLRR
ncbi:Lrp/AsnC family transcriptional regulator [Magnetospirillum aberrantis]|uniref:siroheme decarboxylase n=1 Tax=Magnetospirillum aberrantis SpK TaxID=908842 RepID=A0A7C9V085_9PROT|nr:Lrp/AsnC family transcriptional regulator [Magnetospirillum aberrantis]NFV81011.1 Lrp/AsnC family transcriptional regulator [Magnetospirillum aberrantis SpK]